MFDAYGNVLASTSIYIGQACGAAIKASYCSINHGHDVTAAAQCVCPSTAADRWQALQQLRCCIQAVAPQPSAAAPCMPLWEAFADGAATLLQVLFAAVVLQPS